MSISQVGRRSGFSRAELTVLFFIGFLVLGLFVPMICRAQLRAGKLEIFNNLKQLCFAVHNNFNTYNKLPPACDQYAGVRLALPVHVYLLPFIERESVYKSLLENKGKGEATEQRISVFLSANDPSNIKKDLKGVQNFAANMRVFSTKGINSKFDGDMPALDPVEPGKATIFFRDGTSNTILFSTKFGYCGKGGSRYISPPNSPSAAFFGQNAARMKAHPSDKKTAFQLIPGPKDCCVSPLMAQSFYRYSIQVGMADGSSRDVSADISPTTWNAAMHPKDGHALGADWED